MIDTILAAIDRTPGMIGAAVYDDAGACVGHTFRPPYDPVIGEEIVARFDALAGFASSLDNGQPDSLVVETDAALILVKKLPAVSLVILAQPTVNAAMLHVAMNSAALKLSSDGRSNAMSRSTSHAMSGHALSSHAMSQSVARDWSQRPASSVTRNVMGGLGSVINSEVPPDAVGSAFVRHVLRVFTRFAGDQAKFILRDELVRMGVRPQTLRKSQVADFLAALGDTIPSRRERRRFRTEALGA